jgi:NAD(P)-dependent dehydrogenase (short-subunit alcohol dehydrogenase family)
MAVNVKGAYVMMRNAALHMGRGSTILNVISISLPRLKLIDYDASKAALLSLTVNAAFALAGQGITVNAVGLPAVIDTKRHASWGSEEIENAARRTPLGPLSALEAAEQMLALVVNHARSATGELFNLRGGRNLPL